MPAAVHLGATHQRFTFLYAALPPECREHIRMQGLQCVMLLMCAIAVGDCACDPRCQNAVFDGPGATSRPPCWRVCMCRSCAVRVSVEMHRLPRYHAAQV